MHRFLFLTSFVILIACSSLRSQDIVWARQSEEVIFGGGVGLFQLELDATGNLYVLYHLRSRAIFENVEYESVGDSDILLIKYNPQGNIIWTRQMGGSEWDSGYDISIDQSNNLLITGIMPNGGSFLGETLDINNGGAFFAKIAPSGSLVWVRQYGGINGQGYAITSDKFNNVIVGGSPDLDNGVVAKYTPDGTLLWSESIVYNSCCVRPHVEAIETDGDNNIIIGGDFNGEIKFAGQILDAATSGSAFIFKLDADGGYIWSNQVDAGGWSLNDAKLIHFAIDPSGDIFITGYFEDTALLDEFTLKEKNPIDDRTGFVTRIDKSGKFLWATALYGRSAAASRVRINPTTNELNIVGSTFQWFVYDDQYESSIKQNQSFIVTTDKNGTFRSCMFLDPEKHSIYFGDVAFTSTNEFYAGGNFAEDFALGCFGLDAGGGFGYTSFLFKSGEIPEVTVSNLDALCVDDLVRVEAEGADLATSFVWYFPEGTESASGSFTTTLPLIDVTLTEYHENASITVVPFFECYPRTEFSAPLEMDHAPDRPEKPTGDTILCGNSESVYTTALVEGTTSYTWTLSNNLTMLQQSTNEINIKANDVPTTGSIQVQAVNNCGMSALSEPLTVTIAPKPAAPTISGPTTICAGAENVQYTTSNTDSDGFGWRISYPVSFNSVSDDDDFRIAFHGRHTRTNYGLELRSLSSIFS